MITSHTLSLTRSISRTAKAATCASTRPRQQDLGLPDGSVIWVSSTKVPLYDEAGNITGTLGVSRDISQQKQAEEKIMEQLDELLRWQEVTMDREMRVIELKREVNDLLAETGKPPRYASVQLDTESPDIGLSDDDTE